MLKQLGDEKKYEEYGWFFLTPHEDLSVPSIGTVYSHSKMN